MYESVWCTSDKYVRQAFKLFVRKTKRNKYCAFFSTFISVVSSSDNKIQRQTFFHSTASINFVSVLFFADSFMRYRLHQCTYTYCILSNLHLCYENTFAFFTSNMLLVFSSYFAGHCLVHARLVLVVCIFD